MRVGYDEQVFLAQRHGGISRYVVSLIAAFRQDPELGVQPVPGWSYAVNEHAAHAGLSRPIPALNTLLAGRLASIGLAGYYLANRRARANARTADILHYTYSHPRFLASGFRGIQVCTVYDMIPEMHPESFPERDPHVGKRRFVAACDVVMCISESTRRDLVSIYGDPGVPMPVTYLGVDPAFFANVPPPVQAPARYVLFVGRRDGYKDFATLADAFAGLPDDGTVLVAVGGGPFTDAESLRLTRLGIADRTRHVDADDSTLPAWYAGALAFVFPSRYEGFGLPTLEAMASGTATILADSSSHPEVGGDVARYFPPADAQSLGQVLAEILGDDRLRAHLAQRGVQRAAEFTWTATARTTAAAYAAAIGAEWAPV